MIPSELRQEVEELVERFMCDYGLTELHLRNEIANAIENFKENHQYDDHDDDPCAGGRGR